MNSLQFSPIFALDTGITCLWYHFFILLLVKLSLTWGKLSIPQPPPQWASHGTYRRRWRYVQISSDDVDDVQRLIGRLISSWFLLVLSGSSSSRPGLYPAALSPCPPRPPWLLGLLEALEALKNIKMSLANKYQYQSQYPFRPATNSILFALLWYSEFY